MLLNINKKFLVVIILVAFFLPLISQAAAFEGAKDSLTNFLNISGYSMEASDPLTIISTVVLALLSLVGVAFLLLTVYAGIRWMTAGGNEEQVTEAKAWIKNAVIGLAIIFGAYIITFTIIKGLGAASQFRSGYDTQVPGATVSEF
ncbi:MAG: pilin [Patescibacteria group bacterium]|jgi:hypothetical protein